MNIKDYITRGKRKAWEPLIEKGVHYEGVYVKSLYFDKATNRSTSILLKFEKGASYPYHIHPAGEEILVLEGSCDIHTETLTQGRLFIHAAHRKAQCKHKNRVRTIFIRSGRSHFNSARR